MEEQHTSSRYETMNPMPPQVELVCSTQCALGENPLWHAGERALYWADITRGRLHRYTPATGQCKIVREAAGALGGFTLEHDGSLALFLDGGRITRWLGGVETPLLDGIAREQHSRFNDVIADPAGRVFAGVMRTTTQSGALYCVDGRLQPAIVVPDVACPNGMAFTADLTSLYFIDTQAPTLSRFRYDAATGTLSERTEVIRFDRQLGLPDGMTIDEEDHLWIAFWNGSRIARYSPSGQEIARYSVPAPRVTSLTFGGDALDTLYITTAALEDTSANGAGALYMLTPGVRGRTEFRSQLGVRTFQDSRSARG